MSIFKHILAATSLSEGDVPALLYARMLAGAFGARLTVMYSDPIVYPIDMLGPSPAVFVAPTEEHKNALREQVATFVATHLPGDTPDIEVTVGQPIFAILSEAQQCGADLIVVGGHHHGGWRRAVLGSTSEGVVHGSRIPVLTVGSDLRGDAESRAVRNVLCPVNRTDVARHSVQFAAEIARAFGAALLVVHVIENDEPASDLTEAEILDWIGTERRTALTFRQLTVRGGAAERVLDCAEDSRTDLLVIGAQHKRFRDDTVVGTTTDRLIRFASCPVLVVPRAKQMAIAASPSPRAGDHSRERSRDRL